MVKVQETHYNFGKIFNAKPPRYYNGLTNREILCIAKKYHFYNISIYRNFGNLEVYIKIHKNPINIIGVLFYYQKFQQELKESIEIGFLISCGYKNKISIFY